MSRFMISISGMCCRSVVPRSSNSLVLDRQALCVGVGAVVAAIWVPVGAGGAVAAGGVAGAQAGAHPDCHVVGALAGNAADAPAWTGTHVNMQ